MPHSIDLLAFVVISVGVIVMPGPNVLVIVSTSIAHGKRRGLQTVFGTSAAMMVQLCVAALGTAWFVNALSTGFLWLKWLGVIYLIYLGVMHLFASKNSQGRSTGFESFQRGFWVSLTNPKTILFFSAFLPQFIVSAERYFQQVVVLSAVFWLLAIALDSAYALLADKLTTLIENRDRSKRLSGVFYLAAGTTLAAAKLNDR